MKKFIVFLQLCSVIFVSLHSSAPSLPALTQEEWEEQVKTQDQAFFKKLGDDNEMRFMAGQMKSAVNPNPEPHTVEDKERALKFKLFYDLKKEKRKIEELPEQENKEFETLSDVFKKHTAARKIQEAYKKHRELSTPSMIAAITPITGLTPITHITAITALPSTSETDECAHCKPTLQSIRYEKFKEFLMDFAEKNYTEFKRLVCTHEYLTKTDWLYQFIETMRDVKIFKRNADGSINPNEFQDNINPSWLEEYMVKTIEGLHTVVHGAFIDMAIKKITKEKMSWIDAVSIVAPKDQYGFAQGSRMYPIAFFCIWCDKIELILAEILSKLPVQAKLNLNLADITTEETNPDGYTTYDVTIWTGDTFYTSEKNDQDLLKTIEQQSTYYFLDYLQRLGHELTPEEEILESLIGNEYFFPEHDLNNETPELMQEYDHKALKYYVDNFQFEQSHINWRKAADQTFLLGCLIIDKNLDAYDALGGDAWLEQQASGMQNALKPFIQKLQNSVAKKRFKQKSKNKKPVTATPGSSALQSKKVKYPTQLILQSEIPDKQITKAEQLSNLKESWSQEKRNLMRDLNQ